MIQKLAPWRWSFLLLGIFVLVAGVVLNSHSQAMADPWQQAPHSLTISAPSKLPNAVSLIKRDPFAGAPAAGSSGNLTNTGFPNVTGIVPQGGPGVPSMGGGVPNPGGPGVVPTGGLSGTITVLATEVSTTGNRPPLAIISNGGQTQIVGIDDVLGGHRIVLIVSQGIQFDDGERLSINAQSNRSPSGQTTTIGVPSPSFGGTIVPNAGAPAITPVPSPTSNVSSNGAPTINRNDNYKFGPLPTPLPGQTPVPVPHYYATPNP